MSSQVGVFQSLQFRATDLTLDLKKTDRFLSFSGGPVFFT